MKSLWIGIVRWFDSDVNAEECSLDDRQKVSVLRLGPILTMHAMCLAVIWTGFSAVAVLTAIALYLVRMFAITAFYHRYFSHRTFKTSRWMQFLFAIAGNTAAQRGPLWWAANHRHHHKHSDTDHDLHSPLHGLWHSHIGWLATRGVTSTHFHVVKDLAKYKELRFLDRFDLLIPMLLAGALFGIGEVLAHNYPSLGTNGWQMMVWGFFISTVVLLHGTCLINSLAHIMGTRRYETDDSSRNSMILSLITLGEGWHNNHHRYPGVTRQGFLWWEIDITYYVLKIMAAFGLVWDLRPVPENALEYASKPHREPSDVADISPFAPATKGEV